MRAPVPRGVCHVIVDAGDLPCVEIPAANAAIPNPFLKEHANV